MGWCSEARKGLDLGHLCNLSCAARISPGSPSTIRDRWPTVLNPIARKSHPAVTGITAGAVTRGKESFSVRGGCMPTPTALNAQTPTSTLPAGWSNLWTSLESISRPMAAAKGKILFQQGEAGRGVFLLHEGKIRLSLHRTGRKEAYRIAGPGNILGLPATLSHAPYSLTAKNLTDCEIGFAPAEDVINLLSKHSDLCFQAVEIMAQEVRRLRKKQAGQVPPRPPAKV
jgi:Cyclic nucleotide-binding domain